jgi:hypothetical protein
MRMRLRLLTQAVLGLCGLCLWPMVSMAQMTLYERSGTWSSFYLPSEQAWAAATKSDKTADGYVTVRFHPSRNCRAQVTYSTPSPPVRERRPDGPFVGTLELRVDSKEPWIVADRQATVYNGLSIDGTRAVYSLVFNVSLEFVLELTEGNFFRMFDRASDATERFGLTGSSVALNRSYSRCKALLDRQSTQPPASQSRPVPAPAPRPAPAVPPRSKDNATPYTNI